jgi:hypothetical protein
MSLIEKWELGFHILKFKINFNSMTCLKKEKEATCKEHN